MLAYFDCYAGIAGDMTLAALIDLGLEPKYLEDQLSYLDLPGYNLNIRRSKRGAIAGIRFEVQVHQDQPHRSYPHISSLIDHSGLEETTKNLALEMFRVLAEAEAKVHGVHPEDVHFHEVGAVDSIVDIVGTAVAIHRLGISRIVCSPLPLSRNYVKTSHGNLPSPAPATLEILKGVPVIGAESSIEMVTPTGAVIARCLADEFGPYPSFTPIKTGYGLGASDPPGFPNALRVVLGTSPDSPLEQDRVGSLECQVDDLDPRVLGDLMDRLFDLGALDVTFSPVQMKKNRPGTLIRVLVNQDTVSTLAEVILTHTTTLGVRLSYVDRIVLARASEVAATSLGPVRIKVVEMPGGRVEKRAEYDDVRSLSTDTGRPLREILRLLDKELNE